MSQGDPKPSVHPPREALLALAASAALAALVRFVPEGDPGGVVRTLAPTLQVLAWTVPIYALAARRGVDPLEAHALLVKPERWLLPLVLAFALLPLYALGYFLWTGGWRGGPFPAAAVPLSTSTIALVFFWHVAFAALPEEYFFRGALQPAVGQGKPWLGVVLASALFALVHVVFDRDPARANVFFPGLVFGLLRLRTGSIVPGVLFHAACNALDLTLRNAYP